MKTKKPAEDLLPGDCIQGGNEIVEHPEITRGWVVVRVHHTRTGMTYRTCFRVGEMVSVDVL